MRSFSNLFTGLSFHLKILVQRYLVFDLDFIYGNSENEDFFALAYRFSQSHKEGAAAIVHPFVCGGIAFSFVLQQVCVQVFDPIRLVAVPTGPGADRYSAVLHELGMSVHHPPLFRAPRAHAVHFSTV